MIGEYLRLSLRSLSNRRLRSWLTMLGIFIGIAAVVSLIGLGEGLRNAINSQFGFLGTDIIAVTASGGMGPPGSGVPTPLTNKEMDAIKKIPGVDGVGGRLLESCKIKFNEKLIFSYVASVPDGDSRDIIEHVVGMEAQKGRLLEDGDNNVAFLGSMFYEEDNAFDKIITPGSKIEIQDKEFKVIGIMDEKGSQMLDNSVFMNEDALRELVDRQGEDYDIIGVRFKENADVDEIKFDIENKLRKIRDVKEGEEDFSVETPQSMLESVNSIILGVQIFIYIIAGISILVGGIGIMNTMYTSVVERTKEVGIMKSIGAKNSTIFALFFIESGFLGTVGGIIGIILGVSIASGLAFIGQIALGSDLISAHFPSSLIIGALMLSFILGSFFGTLPAIQASRLNPVDALRYAK